MLAQPFALGLFGTIWCDFGSLLKKLLFLGRTLLLRLQGYQTCGGAGMLLGVANAVVVQHFVLGMFCRTYFPISVAY